MNKQERKSLEEFLALRAANDTRKVQSRLRYVVGILWTLALLVWLKIFWIVLFV